MDKKRVVQQIQQYLAEQLADIPESEYADQAEKVQDLKNQLLMFRFLPLREFGPEDVAVPAALVELELGKTHAFYFIAPQGGGLVTSVDGQPVQVITPSSPLGDALLGKRAGETVEVEVRGAQRRYRVVAVT